MKQFFIFGASSVYGVGSESGGWGDLIKLHVNKKLYSQGGIGEKCEVFNFSKAGSTIEFVVDTAEWIYDNYSRGGDVITIVSVGGNDSKAENSPDNFVCTPDEFRSKIKDLLGFLKEKSSRVIFVSNGFVDETKTNPKQSPFGDGKVSYFTNSRRVMFSEITRQVCEDMGIDFVYTNIEKDIWVSSYLYDDGLHPNQAGYQKVFEAIRPIVDKELDSIDT